MFILDFLKWEILCPGYFHNKLYMAGCYGLLLVGKKSNFSDKFKLKPIAINHL